MSATVASMIGLGPHDMSGGDWALAAGMMVAWAVLAVVAVFIAVRVTR